MKIQFAKWAAAVGMAAALAGPARSQAASAKENRDYAIATNLFAAPNYPQAEKAFASFVDTYTNSARLTNALLFLARSRIEMSNYAGALDLLKRRLPPDDATALQLMARAYYGEGDYTNAMTSCDRWLARLPANSPLRLGAARLQAEAMSKLRNWPGVIGLMSRPEGAFQQAARAAPGSKEAVSGLFLLGEAYRNERRYDEAESVIRRVETNALAPDLMWEREYLLCRILLEAGRTEEALTHSIELAALQAGQDEGVATAFLRGEILERLDRTADALEEYGKNLAPGLPAEANRQALGKVVELTPRAEAIQRLEDFIGQRPKDPILDLARWYLGDLRLKAYFAPPEPGANGTGAGDTNYLQEAVTNLTRLIQDFPESELLGKAHLDLGWSDWARGKLAPADTNYLRAAETNFLQAVFRLPPSEDRAVAIFKLADTEFLDGDYADAARYYNVLLKDYATMGSVTNGLFDLALYQLAQADIRLGDQQGAEEAANRIIRMYRESGFGERTLLLLGEDASRKGDYGRARATFTNLLATYPNTALQPDIQWAVARTYEQEGDWSHALGACESWLQNPNFATNALRPEVEFARALDTAKAGMETNALARMTNFVGRYQSNSLARGLAAQAQNWIGDYYRNHGDDSMADYAYQNLWRLFPDAGDLVFQARLMAGRAAEDYDPPQAKGDYSYLVDNTNTPAAILAEAWFRLGYTDFLQFQANPNLTNLDLIRQANSALSKVTNASPSNPLAPQALGQLGNCWLAWAPLQTVLEEKTKAYQTAAQMFEAELNLPQSDVTARSQAEYGLGLVEQAQNHPEEALAHYLRVVYDDSEKPDPAWVKEAGVAAVRLYEEQKDWTNAVRVYARVKAVVPTIGGSLRPPSDSGLAPP